MAHPTARILVTGYEVLLGDTRDTNGPYLAQQLDASGFDVESILIVGDDRPRLVEALRNAAGSCAVVLMTGGLGPTEDDHTREAFAEAFNRSLHVEPSLHAELKARLDERGYPMGPSMERQVTLPEGAVPLPNPLGTAAGFALEVEGTWFCAAPGVPKELHVLWEEGLRPHLAQRHTLAPPLRASFWTFGKRESELVELLSGYRDSFPQLELGYRATLKGIQVKLRTRSGHDVAAEAFADAKAALSEALGVYNLGEEETRLEVAVARLLTERGLTLAVAESFTGGLVAHQLTNVPGASGFFRSSIVAYTARMKQDLLGVPPETIAEHSVYSEAVASAMAEGARDRSGASIALSTTGLAGPATGDEPLPVGSVFFGLALPDGTVHTRSNMFSGPREFIKRLGANAALYFLYRTLAKQ